MWAREPLDENGRRGRIKESTQWIENYECKVGRVPGLVPFVRRARVVSARGADTSKLASKILPGNAIFTVGV